MTGGRAYGPGTGGPLTSSPAYAFPLTIIDRAAATFGPDRRHLWRVARRLAVASWASGCVSFTVTEPLPDPALVWTDATVNAGAAALVTPGTITLYRDRSSTPMNEGGYVSPPGAGVAVYAPWPELWRPDRARTWFPAAIAHELGHALGFGHGGTGCMGGGLRPTDADLRLLRTYYCGR